MVEDNSNSSEFAKLLQESEEARLKPGAKVRATVVGIDENNIIFSLGRKIDGYAPREEFVDENGKLTVQKGDSLELFVTKIGEEEIRLGRALSGHLGVGAIRAAFENSVPIRGKVRETVKGGFSVNIMGKRAFCPMSQMDIKKIEDPSAYIGQTFDFLVTHFEKDGKDIVVSRRKLLLEARKANLENLLQDLRKKDTVSGKVTRLTDFGAFVEILPGIEGLLHISEMSWSRIQRPDEIVQVGQELTLKVLEIKKNEDGTDVSISLSLKRTQPAPWDSAAQMFKPGERIVGRVTRLTDFGAFVEVAPGIEGLVHVSELSYTKRVKHPEEILKAGECVEAVILSIDPAAKRLSLSIKDAGENPWDSVPYKYPPGAIVKGTVEKRENFGWFIKLEPGITGLVPAGSVTKTEKLDEFKKLRPGDEVELVVVDSSAENKKITLAPRTEQQSEDWRQFTGQNENSGMEEGNIGILGEKIMENLKKNKKGS